MRAIMAVVISTAMIGLASLAAAGAKSTSAREQAYYGVYRAIVADAADAEGRARVKVKFPWLPGSNSTWAERSFSTRPAPDAAFSIARVGDEVVIAFEHGDFRRPIVIGFLWDSKEKPPENP